MIKFVSHRFSPNALRRCANCGKIALHKVSREGRGRYLCCQHAEEVSGQECGGHDVVGVTGVTIISPEEVELLWHRLSEGQDLSELRLVWSNGMRMNGPVKTRPTRSSTEANDDRRG
jgi:ssDNA-binding Zn-finger/Zn-ribbon topoisomerase 1